MAVVADIKSRPSSISSCGFENMARFRRLTFGLGRDLPNNVRRIFMRASFCSDSVPSRGDTSLYCQSGFKRDRNWKEPGQERGRGLGGGMAVVRITGQNTDWCSVLVLSAVYCYF